MNASSLVTLVAALSIGCGPAKPAPVEPAPPEPADAAPAAVSEKDKEAEQVAAIEYAVNTTAEAVHACYKLATAEAFRMEGVVVLGVAFGDGGTPEVSIAGDEPKSPALNDCLVKVFTALQWPPVFDPGDSIELPLSFVAAPAQYTVRSAQVTPREVAPGLTARVVLDEASTGNTAAALTLLELGPGFEVPMHTHPSAELLYVTEGGGVVRGVRGKGTEVAPGSAIYIAAGVPHAFTTGDGGAHCVQLYAPGGPEQRFEGDKTRTDTVPVSAKEQRKLARKRGVGLPLVAALDGVKRYEIAGGKAAVSILFDKEAAGDGAAYVGVLTAEPGMQVPAHAHASETEVLYVLEGGGVTTVGGVDYPVEPGMGIQIPPGTEHSLAVSADGQLEVVQFYTPSGPEQRFKK